LLSPGGLNSPFETDSKITFKPSAATVDSTEIAFVQIVRLQIVILPTVTEYWDMIKGDPQTTKFMKPFYSRRIVQGPAYGAPAEEEDRSTPAGWNVDRVVKKVYGWYGYNGDGKPNEMVTPGKAPGGLTNAVLHDIPGWNRKSTLWEFETYAIAKSGKQIGQVYGGVRWGFYVDADGVVHSNNRTFLNKQSAEFKAAVVLWNAQANGATKMQNAVGQKTLPAFVDP
jgi:hypothetical protein